MAFSCRVTYYQFSLASAILCMNDSRFLQLFKLFQNMTNKFGIHEHTRTVLRAHMHGFSSSPYILMFPVHPPLKTCCNLQLEWLIYYSVITLLWRTFSKNPASHCVLGTPAGCAYIHESTKDVLLPVKHLHTL